MTIIQQILKNKKREVISVRPDETVLEAIQVMADNDIGSVVVVDGGKVVGMFTERHYARKVILKGRSSPKTKVGTIMTTKVVYVGPERTVEECMAIMTENAIRHLPVLSEGRLVGIVSIGDLVKNTISHQKFLIDQLQNYITS
ncbi:MAG: CBS domain-containing protein [Leisingera sp.]